jgi:hypothetical protein
MPKHPSFEAAKEPYFKYRKAKNDYLCKRNIPASLAPLIGKKSACWVAHSETHVTGFTTLPA